MSNKYKYDYVIFDWGGTLAYSGTRDIFAKSKNIKNKLAVLYPDVIDTLVTLKKKGIKMGIISNTNYPYEQLSDAFIKSGLNNFFDFAIYSNQPNMLKKPAPTMFIKSLEYIKSTGNTIIPSRILYVGNKYDRDIVGASQCKFKTALITRNRLCLDLDQIKSIYPTHIISKIEQICNLLI